MTAVSYTHLVIVEAVAGNMNMVPATQEFLDTMREETAKHGTVLIVDEVMTGFRVALGGAQSLYHIDPDITMFGKVIGGGMPVAAFGGKRDIMNCVAPLGPVYQEMCIRDRNGAVHGEATTTAKMPVAKLPPREAPEV